MNTADLTRGARSDSHRYYTTELQRRIGTLAAEVDTLRDLVADLDHDPRYPAPASKGALRDAMMGLGAVRRVLEHALRELPAP